jgi:hypothetical protein
MLAIFISDTDTPDAPPVFATCDPKILRAVARIVTRRLNDQDDPPPRLRGVPTKRPEDELT